MKRILSNTGTARRANLSLAILAAVFAYGLWELWVAATVTASLTGYLFAALFIGGSLYGIRVTLAEARDLAVSFDADVETGEAKIALWRPFHMKHIDTALDRMSDWQHWVQTASRGRSDHFLLAREETYDGVLRFALEPGMTIPDELRRIAPEAVADFKRAAGRQKD
jgi:hypothetical protein